MIESVSRALARKKDGEKGFTLIELLVVVIIIGILAAIAIPVFLNMRQGAWRSSVESDVNNAILAVEQAAQANSGSYNGLTPTAADASTDADPTQGTVGDQTFTASDGNKITVTIAADKLSYDVVGTNKNVKDGDTLITYTYDSEDGSKRWSDK